MTDAVASPYTVELPVFTGPLDLLLHLVQKEELNIYDIPVARITEQYLRLLGAMQEMDLNVAADFLVMAATLIQIKARLLLPKPSPAENSVDDDEGDPRAELVRQLVEYRRYKESAGSLAALMAEQNRWFGRINALPEPDPAESRYLPGGEVSLLMAVFQSVLAAVELEEPSHPVQVEQFNVEEKMAEIVAAIRGRAYLIFTDLFASMRSRNEVVVTFLALLELVRLGLAAVRQEKNLGRLELFAGPATPGTRSDEVVADESR